MRFVIFLLIVFLAGVGCGGGGGGSDYTIAESEDAADVDPADIRIGAVIDGDFAPGRIAVSVPSEEQLPAYSNAALTVSLRDTSGNAYTTPVDIHFSSNFADTGGAKLDSVVTTQDGTATATYQARGGVGRDNITATVVIGDVTLTANGAIEVAGTQAGAIEFVAAAPETIALAGTGGAGRSQTSVLTFRVVDTQGSPSAGQRVNFELSTTAGGLEIDPESAVSNADGIVETFVKSGNVATVVRVVATIEDTSISTTSDLLVVSTGLPDQNSFSIISTELGFSQEAGHRFRITVNAADHFNNPVPDGTAVYFSAESGMIQSQCLTAGGSCSVVWSSPESPNNVEVLATALGEESFIDVNGDGAFNKTDSLYWPAGDWDLPLEPYRDDNGNGEYDGPSEDNPDQIPEEFLDANGDGVFTPDKNGIFNGLMCRAEAEADGVCTRDLIYIRDSLPLNGGDDKNLRDIRMGGFIDGAFVRGQLALSIDAGQLLEPYGTARVEAALIDANGEPYGTPIEINFTSRFASQGKAEIDEIVPTVDGTATAVYRAKGGVGIDTISASTFVDILLLNDDGLPIFVDGVPVVAWQKELTAVANIGVAPSDAVGIEFVSSNPDSIVLSGTGGVGRSEIAEVLFRVVDERGQPVPNQSVDFELSSTAGGISLNAASEITDNDGLAAVYVQAGNVPTSVRVVASLPGTTASTPSDILTVCTGLPDQNSFSIISTELGFSPATGYRFQITAHAADHFNNPVPDGTAVSFTTEAGMIENRCLTSGGSCSVVWSSPEPPRNVAVLATALGEESFIDVNGNGVFDDAEAAVWPLAWDLPLEPYRDDNGNGQFDEGEEEFLDYNGDETYTPDQNGIFNGLLCQAEAEAAGLCTRDLIYVRDSLPLNEGDIGDLREIRMGAIIDGEFVKGELALSIPSGQLLEPYGTATVEATLIDSNGELYESPIEIDFTSRFASQGKAQIDETATTVDGTAAVVYRAKGGVGIDTITASTVVDIYLLDVNDVPVFAGQKELTAVANIGVEAAPAASIEFVSAAPESIVLSGTGGFGRSESSNLVFRVVDANGNPSPNRAVTFELSTTIGGLSLSTGSQVSDAGGLLEVAVKSGSVPTSVRVKATLENTAIFTQSDLLVVSTGLPDQDSFSMVASGGGTGYSIFVLASDHFNNPVPDGTAVYFTAERGQIEAQCQIISGSCTVQWRDTVEAQGVVILATAIGEESFIDVNGDGIFNAIDQQNWKPDRYDMPLEPFRDDNENGIFDFGDEEFRDYNENGTYNPVKNGIYNGTLCSQEAEDQDLCTQDLLYVRQSVVLGTEIVSSEVRLGSVENNIFTEGQLSTSLGAGQQLAPSGTATVTAVLVDENGDPVDTPVDIFFSSRFADEGKAEIDALVTTVDGSATAVYTATGGVGEDVVTATANVGGKTLTAKDVIDVAGAPPWSISFVSAEPETIVLRGTGEAGSTETSKVTFKVVDSFGAASPNQTVDFELSTTVGGLDISPVSAVSNSEGLVSTYVRSGSVATSVRVKATVNGTAITTQSDRLIVSTGLPDQNSFSLSAELYNPEGWQYDGEVVLINVYAADHFNNPVPDGTAIFFTTEGGQIQDQCFTEDGFCSVEWRSSEPRPLIDGRVTILASTIGEESFIDVDGDGLFTATDEPHWPPIFDLPEEAFRDDDEDTDFTEYEEEFVDFNGNGVHDSDIAQIYNGTLCSDDAETAGLCSKELINVRGSLFLVMSGSFAEDIQFIDPNDQDNPNDDIILNEIDLTTQPDGVQLVEIRIADLHNQPMPFGTAVSVTTTNGTLLGKTEFEVASTNQDGPISFFLTIERDPAPNDKTAGNLQVNVTTPKGNESSTAIRVLD